MTRCTMEIDMSYPVELFDRIRTTSTEYAHINVFSGYVIKDRITVEYNGDNLSARLSLSRADAQALYAALGKHLQNIALEAPADAA